MLDHRKTVVHEPGYHEYGTYVVGSFDAYFDGEYIGSRNTEHAAQALLDAYVFEGLRRGTIPTDEQLAQRKAEQEAAWAAEDASRAEYLAYRRALPQLVAEWEAELNWAV